MVKTVLNRLPAWVAGSGPESALVPACRGSLSRNLADFPFPPRCTLDERQEAEERVVAALTTVFDHNPLLGKGEYCPIKDLEPWEARVLAERFLIPASELPQDGTPRDEAFGGVYVSEDRSLGIIVNGHDHLRILGMTSGLQPQELWIRLNLVDDALAAALDYAFSEERGHLTSNIGEVGTGLCMTALLHLPALALSNKLLSIEQQLRSEYHLLGGVFGGISDARGNLYALSNRATLGRSEEEVTYHVRHAAARLLALEKAARQTMMADGRRGLEDRVGRALGLARGARLLELDEAVGLLSSLRLGLSSGLLQHLSFGALNELLLGACPGHLALRTGRTCDDLTLSMERADLFRAKLSEDRANGN